jgi:anti-anti-sigma regulatory factor
MANDRPRANRAPPTTADPSSTDHNTPVDNANAIRDRLDRALDGRLAFGQAQGMLSEIAGCTPSRASEVLLQVGAQLGFESADGVAEFFLASAATDPAGPDTLAFTQAATVARDTGSAADDFATLIAGGRGVVVRGELDLATVPLLAAAFADHQAAVTAPRRAMLLDLHDMTFIDITGVRALSEIRTQAGDLGYHLRVDLPSDAFTLWTLKFAVQSGWLQPVFADGASRLH